MTENEAKRFLKIEKECINRNCDRNCAQCDIVQKVEDLNSAYDAAIKALEDVLQYRALEKRLSDMFCSSVSLKSVVDELERNLKEPDSPHPMKARILTYKESADWDAYRAIGTPEECLRDKDFLDFLADKINPNDFETYLRIYNSQDKKGGGVDGD